MRRMPLCVQRDISALSCLHLERGIAVEHIFSSKISAFNSHTTHAERVCQNQAMKSHVITSGHVPANKHDRVCWLYRWIVFKTQKHFWLTFRSNYAACVAGIWSSALSKAVTYSWNELPFFIDIIFHVSQCWLRIPVVLVLDILQTLNKLHSAGSIKISFSGKRWHSVRRNNLLVQQNSEHFCDWERNFHICIDIWWRFYMTLFWTLKDRCISTSNLDCFGACLETCNYLLRLLSLNLCISILIKWLIMFINQLAYTMSENCRKIPIKLFGDSFFVLSINQLIISIHVRIHGNYLTQIRAHFDADMQYKYPDIIKNMIYCLIFS